ncbi:MAG: glutamate-5-semialdehyde dehydrogenase [Lachnospiraceae bacterium]|nr:glutamate-5-semialdehyde dehydrogenase [Lachnospiraceae bacterium]
MEASGSKQICSFVCALPEYREAEVIYCYVDYNHEVRTWPIMEQAVRDGKQVAVPRVDGETMEFYLIQGQEDLESGYSGILEPKQGLPAVSDGTDARKRALFLMPGVAFDRNHHRVGYGGGFYDRYLEAHPELVTAALAYECQIFATVPFEKFDILPQILITETGVSRRTKGLADELKQMGERARKASVVLGTLGVSEKNRGLLAAAEALKANAEQILKANEADMEAGRERGMHEGLLDRLCLTKERIASMAEGLTQVASLDDPVGEVLSMKKRPNGLVIGEKRVPLGVIGIIYESRPNVTADAFGLCFKAGNAVILKGGSDALQSNLAIASVIREALTKCGLPGDSLQLVASTDRETARLLMRMNGLLDVLIPRGGAGLIRTVVENSTVPVIETGTGNCHIFVDESADLSMAADIIINAKTQRIGVCNACESVLIHKNISKELWDMLAGRLSESHVEIRGDEMVCSLVPEAVKASEEDWGKEYLDYILSAKTVDSVEEAIAHINRYNTKHSEAIITKSYGNAQKFLDEVDAAAVYVNASTRFTDGFEFGFGAEIGISTQKLHARGPMGLTALTTTKYIIYGNGQVRP